MGRTEPNPSEGESLARFVTEGPALSGYEFLLKRSRKRSQSRMALSSDSDRGQELILDMF